MSSMGRVTLLSITLFGCVVLGLGGNGNLSDVPELGGLNADRGKRGRALGPLRRTPTPGEGGVAGIMVLMMAKRMQG
jgi:hypothetical protein